jgi:aldehyde:ferredoxin oxidoreductase
LCVFLLGSTGARPELITDMLNAAYGTQLAPTALSEMGQHVLDLERAFNHRAGLTQATDRLPQFFLEEPLPPHGERFDVQAEDLAGIWEQGD